MANKKNKWKQWRDKGKEKRAVVSKQQEEQEVEVKKKVKNKKNKNQKRLTRKDIEYMKEEKRKKQQELLKASILTFIQKTEENKFIWHEIVNSISATLIKKRYAFYLDKETTFYFDVMVFKDRVGEEKTNIGLVKEVQGQITFQSNLSNKDEDIQRLYSCIQNSANNSKKTEEAKKEIEQRPKERQINHNDFVICTNEFRCNNHLLDEVIGFLKIVVSTGEEIIEKVSCAHCEECNCFYMLEKEYNRIAEKGVILCQLLTYEQYCSMGIWNTSKWSSKSLLMRNGYNVNAKKNLSDKQRQIILKNIVDSNILSIDDIISYINRFIAQRKNIPSCCHAVVKWERDKQFLSTLK